MLDAIKRFVASRIGSAQAGSEPAARRPQPDDIQLAACAILLDLAHADDEFSPAERIHIESAIRRHFGLDADTTRELIQRSEAARRESIDHYRFARTITRHYDLGQKMVLAEVMWGVILADGELSQHESYLVRKLANLLDLAPVYLSQARRAATPAV